MGDAGWGMGGGGGGGGRGGGWGVTCAHAFEGSTTHSGGSIPPAKVPRLLLPNMVNCRGVSNFDSNIIKTNVMNG